MSGLSDIAAILDPESKSGTTPGTQGQKFTPGASFGTPPQLLDNLQKVESGKDAFAVNKDTKAMGPYQFLPDTVAMLHKKGVKFNPFDPAEARSAADWYLQDLQTQHGDLPKAIAAYGGFKTKDPSAYVGAVLAGVPSQSRQAAPAQPEAARSPLGDVASILEGTIQAPKPPPEPAPLENFSQNAVNAMEDSPYALLGKVALNQASGIGSAIIGGYRGLASLVAGEGIDEAARQVASPELAGGLTAAPYEAPEGSTAAQATKVANLPGEAIGWVGKKAGEGVYSVTGSPLAAAAVETGVNAAPLALGLKGTGSTVRPAPKLVGSGSAVPRTAPPVAIGEITNYDVPTYLRREAAARAAQAPAAGPAPAAKAPLALVPAEPVTGRTAAPAAAAGASPKPSLELVPMGEKTTRAFSDPDVLPQEVVAAAAAEAPKFSAGPTVSDTPLPSEAQATRTRVLQDVGIDKVRSSAITGDKSSMRRDYDMSREIGEGANVMREGLQQERQALTDHAESIVRDTGGTPDPQNRFVYDRGNKIIQPFQDLKRWFDSQTKSLYAVADAKSAGMPVQLSKVGEILGVDSKFANTDTIALRKGINDRMRELGIVDKDGNQLPTTVKQAENLRQYLNEEWSPKNGFRIRELKNAIDDDVLALAGQDVFNQARAMRSLRSTVFENDVLDQHGRVIPNGLGKLVDASGKGLELKVAAEKWPSTVADLPVDELAHVVKTLKQMPPELQPQAQAALAEIKATFANRIYSEGATPNVQWGALQISKYLNQRGVATKLRMLFDDAELKKIHDLNEAGNILHTEHYPGAAVQTKNMLDSIIEHGAQSVGASAGSVVGGATLGPVGAAAGAAGGAFGGSSFVNFWKRRRSIAEAEKRFTRLGDIGKTGEPVRPGSEQSP